MLGIGMQEMMIIAVAALLIFGPGKLPEVMGQAGKMYRDFRNMTSELTGEFEKTVAEAKEMGNQITGEIGPMQQQLNSVTKSVERDLGGKGKKTTSTSSRASSSSSKKGTSTSSTKRSSTTSRSSKSTSSKSTTASRTSTGTKSSAAKSTTKKPTAPVATKDDPDSDVSLFVPEPPKRERRARRATPSVITDLTPRDISHAEDAMPEAMTPPVSPVDDALARARARRRNAGYARPSA